MGERGGRRSRRGRWVRWGSAVALVVVVVVAGAGVALDYGVSVPGRGGAEYGAGVSGGGLLVYRSGIPVASRSVEFGYGARSERYRWWFEVSRSWVGESVAVPAWVPVGAFGALAWWVWRRREPDGHCQQCGYSREGLVGGVCPECGEAGA